MIRPMPISLIRGAAGMAVILAIMAGCSTTAPDRPSVTSATAVAEGSTLTSEPPAPSAPPGGELPDTPLTLTGGSAHVKMTGGASEAFDLTLTSGTLIPGSNVILVWSGPLGDESGDDGLRIQAPSEAGVYQSSGDDFLAPQISVITARIGTAGVPPQFAPVGDECTVMLTKVDVTGIEGSLGCHGLTSTAYDEPIDVEANFTASP